MKDDIVLLSHYDLDGAGVSVLSDHIWNVKMRKHQGYAKIRGSLEYLIENWSDKVSTIVIADLKIEPDDLRLACESFENVIYYDHHESSEEFVSWPDQIKNIEVHFDLELCSTALVWMDGVRNRGAVATPELNAFANVVNTYDLWKTTNKRWEQGVLMNDMFWDLHLWEFKKRFCSGFTGFTEQEFEFEKLINAKRNKIIADATIEEMDSGSKIVMIESSEAINFVSTAIEGDMFYIMAPGWSQNSISVRVKDSNPKFNVNDGISELSIRYPKLVQSAGGHASAGGITFLKDVDRNQMADLLYEEDSIIRGEFCQAGT